MNMPVRRSKTRILVDGGDPEETVRVKSLVGYVDGQTTNTTLIAKNPEVQQLVASGYKLSSQEVLDRSDRIAA
jgi:transaldolase